VERQSGIDADAAIVAEEIYVWAYAQEFYKENNALEKGTGFTYPKILKPASQESSRCNL
jgi:hypothetical protein